MTPTYLPATRYGGPIRSVHGLCKALAARGHEVTVYTTSIDGPGDSKVPHGTAVSIDGVNVWYYRSRILRRLYWSPSMERALTNAVGNFDVVHLHSVFLRPTTAAARASRKAGVPYVLSPRGMLVKRLFHERGWLRKSLWVTLFDRKNLEAASAIHTTSALEHDELKAFGYRLPRVDIIPNGVDVPLAERRSERRSNVILFVGRLHPIKRLDALIKAMSELPRCELWIAGNDEGGYRFALEHLARQEGVTSRVKFLGPVDDLSKATLYRQATLFAMPSVSDSFGIAAVEAMAHGCPVIVSRGVGLSAALERRHAGIVIPHADVLAEALKALFDNPQRLQFCARQGLELASEYNWSNVAAKFEQLYSRL